MTAVSYPRRQRRRRAARAIESALAAVIAMLLAGLALRFGLVVIALALLLGACVCVWRSRTWARLARRSAVGVKAGAGNCRSGQRRRHREFSHGAP